MNALDISCYYDEASDEYHIPKDEQDEFIEIFRIIQKQKEQLTKENEKLKYENKNLDYEIFEGKTRVARIREDRDGTEKLCSERIAKVSDENEKLKEEFAGWKSSYDDDIREARAEGIDELKEEIEELKTSLQTTTSYHTDRYELLEDELKKVKDDAEKNDVFCYIKITDLEIENEKLKKERDDFEVQMHKSLEGQVELEEEIQELKEKYEGELLTQEEFIKRSQLD